MVSVESAWSTRVCSESKRTKNWRRVTEQVESARGDRRREERDRGEGGEMEEEGRAVWSFRILRGFMGKTASSVA